MAKQPKYEPPPRPEPRAGTALVSPEVAAEHYETYRRLANGIQFTAGHEAADAAAYIHDKYGGS